MKKVLFVFSVILCFMAMSACDEQQKIDAIRTGQSTANIVATGIKTALEIAHASGNLSDVKWEAFLKLYSKYEAANKLLTDGLNTWEAGVGKTPVERLLEFLKNVNVILEDINNLISAWKTTENRNWNIPLGRYLCLARTYEAYLRQ